MEQMARYLSLAVVAQILSQGLDRQREHPRNANELVGQAAARAFWGIYCLFE
jgi:hypothetical protein